MGTYLSRDKVPGATRPPETWEQFSHRILKDKWEKEQQRQAELRRPQEIYEWHLNRILQYMLPRNDGGACKLCGNPSIAMSVREMDYAKKLIDIEICRDTVNCETMKPNHAPQICQICKNLVLKEDVPTPLKNKYPELHLEVPLSESGGIPRLKGSVHQGPVQQVAAQQDTVQRRAISLSDTRPEFNKDELRNIHTPEKEEAHESEVTRIDSTTKENTTPAILPGLLHPITSDELFNQLTNAADANKAHQKKELRLPLAVTLLVPASFNPRHRSATGFEDWTLFLHEKEQSHVLQRRGIGHLEQRSMPAAWLTHVIAALIGLGIVSTICLALAVYPGKARMSRWFNKLTGERQAGEDVEAGVELAPIQRPPDAHTREDENPFENEDYVITPAMRPDSPVKDTSRQT